MPKTNEELFLEKVKEHLKRLKKAANRYCNLAHQRMHEIEDPVNWGNFQCVSTEYRVTDSGTIYFAVQLEEASPDATQIKEELSRKITKKYGVHCQVDTSW